MKKRWSSTASSLPKVWRKGVAFLTDGSNKVMLELVKIPDVSPLTERMNHHLQLHIALKVLDPDENAEHPASDGTVMGDSHERPYAL
jgi:hypothetical protein